MTRKTPAALDLEFPTLLRDMASPHVLAYPTDTIVAEKAEAMVDLGISNSRMKDFCDVAMAARRVAFDGQSLVIALRATFRRRATPLPAGEIIALSERFVHDVSAQANWKAFAARSQQREFESLQQVVWELQRVLHEPFAHVRSGSASYGCDLLLVSGDAREENGDRRSGGRMCVDDSF